MREKKTKDTTWSMTISKKFKTDGSRGVFSTKPKKLTGIRTIRYENLTDTKCLESDLLPVTMKALCRFRGVFRTILSLF